MASKGERNWRELQADVSFASLASDGLPVFSSSSGWMRNMVAQLGAAGWQ